MAEKPQINAVVKDKAWSADGERAQRAIALATELLRAANRGQTPAERRHGERMHRLVGDPQAKTLSFTLTDQLFRSVDPGKASGALRGALAGLASSPGFSSAEWLMLRAAGQASRVLPGVVLAAVQARLRRESAGVVLRAEPEALGGYLAERRASGMRVNLNQLGEAILGEEEALRRLERVEGLLRRPDVDYVSVKISAIASQLNLLAWDATVGQLKARLRRLYRVALGSGKFVNLDMEEYRDLALTLAAFRETLDEPEFACLRAGIVLQAYLPDSWIAQQELTAWARRRVDAGGAAPKLRIVKGANLAMELVEAELHGWLPAPYGTKAETDANFKRMLEFGCAPENARVLHLGVGSHNLLDVAQALILREENGVGDWVEIEMLEGMATHQARAVHAQAGGLLLYAPIVARDDFGSALAYLIRRLDENTAPENFLHDLFGLIPESAEWAQQARRFQDAWNGRTTVSAVSRRDQLPVPRQGGFANEPDTDWTQVRHRSRVMQTLASASLPVVPAATGLEEVLERATAGQPPWERLGVAVRADVLRECATVLASRRMILIPALVKEGRKSIAEADSEISEAIDFARYYAHTAAPPDGVHARALGVVVIAPPWNFPLAIPAGGVCAALAAGNAVVLKPAPETAATSLALAEALWAGGVPRDALQFFACEDGEIGRALISDLRVSAVVLTGGYDTARLFLSWRPSLRLFAETSGKNALVVTAMADRDLAVRDLARSAFGHSGQKCSAGSLGILEAEVYDDPGFRRQLRDAVASLPVGSAEDPASVVTPLIRPPGDALLRGLTLLDPGEEWLLEPRDLGGDLWSPGIRLGVQKGSWYHQTECFGPVLGLMRARDLDHAIELQNAVPFGLTAGLHTLDRAEVERWKERVVAGNLYVNRGVTGAIVQRQPFGGWKRSSIGPGAKAGGPNYVSMFTEMTDLEPASPGTAAVSFREAWKTHFAVDHDPSGLRAESNVFRYRACRGVVLRLAEPGMEAEAIARLAASTCGVPVEVSHASVESDEAFAGRLASLAERAEFLRAEQSLPDVIWRAAHACGLNGICAPVSACGRVELTRWMREQAVSETRHRYGNILR